MGFGFQAQSKSYKSHNSDSNLTINEFNPLKAKRVDEFKVELGYS